MTTGTVKKVVADRGFGFITASDAKEYFFHRNSLDSSLDFDRLNGGETAGQIRDMIISSLQASISRKSEINDFGFLDLRGLRYAQASKKFEGAICREDPLYS